MNLNSFKRYLSTKKYSSLNEDEEDHTDKLETIYSDDVNLTSRDFPKKSLKWTQICGYGLISALLLVTSGFVGYIVHPNTSTASKFQTSTSELHCGNTSTEARALGCVFDLLTNDWMPEACSDPATNAEYLEWVMEPDRQFGAFPYFYDIKAEHQVETLGMMSHLVGYRIFTTTENHLGHCTFLARRMHRFAMGEIHAAHNTLKHTMHCTSSILEALAVGKTEQKDEPPLGSFFDIGVASCSD